MNNVEDIFEQEEKQMNIKSYAVIRDNRVVSLTTTREEARVKKAKMGGKENGVSIIQLVAKQEVR